MEIVIGKTAGFCFGITNAVNKTEKEIDEAGKVYCLGEIAHNKQIIKELESKGVIFIHDINEAEPSCRMIIRSHGVTKDTYSRAKELGIELIDLTCPKVLKTHMIAEEYAKKGYHIILVGEKDHPEVLRYQQLLWRELYSSREGRRHR